jgi:hypothetical protein
MQTVDKKTHSICAKCAPVFSAMGSVFSGVTAAVTECCFCGHEHRDGLWMTLGVGPFVRVTGLDANAATGRAASTCIHGGAARSWVCIVSLR